MSISPLRSSSPEMWASLPEDEVEQTVSPLRPSSPEMLASLAEDEVEKTDSSLRPSSPEMWGYLAKEVEQTVSDDEEISKDVVSPAQMVRPLTPVKNPRGNETIIENASNEISDHDEVEQFGFFDSVLEEYGEKAMKFGVSVAAAGVAGTIVNPIAGALVGTAAALVAPYAKNELVSDDPFGLITGGATARYFKKEMQSDDPFGLKTGGAVARYLKKEAASDDPFGLKTGGPVGRYISKEVGSDDPFGLKTGGAVARYFKGEVESDDPFGLKSGGPVGRYLKRKMTREKVADLAETALSSFGSAAVANGIRGIAQDLAKPTPIKVQKIRRDGDIRERLTIHHAVGKRDQIIPKSTLYQPSSSNEPEITLGSIINEPIKANQEISSYAKPDSSPSSENRGLSVKKRKRDPSPPSPLMTSSCSNNSPKVLLCREGECDGGDRDYDIFRGDRGNGDRDWSQDPRWKDAERLREMGKALDTKAVDHLFDEATSAYQDWRFATAVREADAALRDKMEAQKCYDEANRIENQIAQDASSNDSNKGCIIS